MDGLQPKIMYIFPGQGAQYKGMGSDIYKEFEEAKKVYDKASDVLGYDMAELSFHDPENKLHIIKYTQPVILTHSMACLEVLRGLSVNKINPEICAGHSLGEYSSLVAAGSLSFEEALKLVEKRGECMDLYGKGITAIFNLTVDELRSNAKKHMCGISGSNAPDQTVVGGLEEDINNLIQNVKSNYSGAKTHRLANVRGAFHTYIMKEAADNFWPTLKRTHLTIPWFKVLSNYTGHYHSNNPNTIKKNLYLQIFNQVKWMWIKQKALEDGINVVIEFGGGVSRGKDDTPEAKRPNLANLTERAIKESGQHAIYLPGINATTLKKTANILNSLETLTEKPHDDEPRNDILSIRGNAVCENWYHLYIPLTNGIITENSKEIISLVGEQGLTDIVQFIGEPVQQNRDFLEYLNKKESEAQPYLEMVYGCETSALTYHLGKEMIEVLHELKKRVDFVKNRKSSP